MKKNYHQDKNGTMVFSARGIECKCIENDKGLPSFEVIGYTDNDNISFRYQKGDIIEPDILNMEYAELLLEVKGEQADEWKTEYITSSTVYGIIVRLDNMSFITLKEIREGFNKRLRGIDNDD